ncbi:hypothetical protein [Amycolatopsis minnesotensis]|uniref:Uncharacterized protein n=1 Tax=Amycolatopsis minnesotensis TaxID=337894 RepID=A0ABN2SAD2_9PSEU
MSGWFRGSRGADDERGGENGGQQLPAIDPRELLNAWIRALTLLGEGRGPDETIASIAQANRPGRHLTALRTPLPADDARALDDVLAWLHEIRTRQAGVNILVEQLLIGWLSEATGRSWNEIVQQLAQEIGSMLPPE